MGSFKGDKIEGYIGQLAGTSPQLDVSFVPEVANLVNDQQKREKGDQATVIHMGLRDGSLSQEAKGQKSASLSAIVAQQLQVDPSLRGYRRVIFPIRLSAGILNGARDVLLIIDKDPYGIARQIQYYDPLGQKAEKEANEMVFMGNNGEEVHSGIALSAFSSQLVSKIKTKKAIISHPDSIQQIDADNPILIAEAMVYFSNPETRVDNVAHLPVVQKRKELKEQLNTIYNQKVQAENQLAETYEIVQSSPDEEMPQGRHSRHSSTSSTHLMVTDEDPLFVSPSEQTGEDPIGHSDGRRDSNHLESSGFVEKTAISLSLLERWPGKLLATVIAIGTGVLPFMAVSYIAYKVNQSQGSVVRANTWRSGIRNFFRYALSFGQDSRLAVLPTVSEHEVGSTTLFDDADVFEPVAPVSHRSGQHSSKVDREEAESSTASRRPSLRNSSGSGSE